MDHLRTRVQFPPPPPYLLPAKSKAVQVTAFFCNKTATYIFYKDQGYPRVSGHNGGIRGKLTDRAIRAFLAKSQRVKSSQTEADCTYSLLLKAALPGAKNIVWKARRGSILSVPKLSIRYCFYEFFTNH